MAQPPTLNLPARQGTAPHLPGSVSPLSPGLLAQFPAVPNHLTPGSPLTLTTDEPMIVGPHQVAPGVQIGRRPVAHAPPPPAGQLPHVPPPNNAIGEIPAQNPTSGRGASVPPPPNNGGGSQSQ
jgi:hypothetical protein